MKKANGKGARDQEGRGDEFSIKVLWRPQGHSSPCGDSASSVKEEGRPGMLARAPVAQVSSTKCLLISAAQLISHYFPRDLCKIRANILSCLDVTGYTVHL